MYIKKLENWSYREWRHFFSQYKNLTDTERAEIRTILTSKYKSDIEAGFKRLSEL